MLEKSLKIGSVNFVTSEGFDENDRPQPYNSIEIVYCNQATDHWNSDYEVTTELTPAQIQSIIDFLKSFQERNKL